MIVCVLYTAYEWLCDFRSGPGCATGTTAHIWISNSIFAILSMRLSPRSIRILSPFGHLFRDTCCLPDPLSSPTCIQYASHSWNRIVFKYIPWGGRGRGLVSGDGTGKQCGTIINTIIIIIDGRSEQPPVMPVPEYMHDIHACIDYDSKICGCILYP